MISIFFVFCTSILLAISSIEKLDLDFPALLCDNTNCETSIKANEARREFAADDKRSSVLTKLPLCNPSIRV